MCMQHAAIESLGAVHVHIYSAVKFMHAYSISVIGASNVDFVYTTLTYFYHMYCYAMQLLHAWGYGLVFHYVVK